MKQSVQVEQSDTELNNRQKTKSPTFDDIYNEIGEFGLYQILVVLSTGFVFFFGSFVTLNFIFGVDVPDHRCGIFCSTLAVFHIFPRSSIFFNFSNFLWIKRC